MIIDEAMFSGVEAYVRAPGISRVKRLFEELRAARDVKDREPAVRGDFVGVRAACARHHRRRRARAGSLRSGRGLIA
jgi:hypothetical protein